MGHQKLAGWLTEQSIAGTNMLRVDVPETHTQPAFTRFVGGSSIYAINPVDQQTAMLMAGRLNAKPITAYDAMAAIEKLHPEASKMLKAAGQVKDAIYEDDLGNDLDDL